MKSSRWLGWFVAWLLGCSPAPGPPCLVGSGGGAIDVCGQDGPKLVCSVTRDADTGCLLVGCSGRETTRFCSGDYAAAVTALARTTCEPSQGEGSACLAIACGADAGLEVCARECSVTGLDRSGCAELTCDAGGGVVVCRRGADLESLIDTGCAASDSGVGCTQLTCADGSAASVCEGVSCTVASLEPGSCARLTCAEGAQASVCAASDPAAVGRSLGAKACSAAFPLDGCAEVRCSDETEARLCSGRECRVLQEETCARVLCDESEHATLCGDESGLSLEGELDATACAVRIDGRGCGELRCGDDSIGSACGARNCSVRQHADGCAALACGTSPELVLCSSDIPSRTLAESGCVAERDGECSAITCEDGSSAQACPYDLPNHDYPTLLAMAVRFFGAQRSGSVDNWLLGGRACHEEDGESVGRDLAGGWHDAGDHLKFSLTIAYTTYALFKAYDAFPAGFQDQYDAHYGPRNGLPDLLDEAAVGADYLTRILLPGAADLVTRVGGDGDHALWVTCVEQENLPAANGGRPRPVRLGSAPDVAALSAAALATAARVMRPFDPGRAATWLARARELDAFAEAHADGPAYSDLYYSDDSALDDRLCGAVELWAATGEGDYLDAALALDAKRGSHLWVLNWSEVSDLCRHTLAKRGHAPKGWQRDVDRYLESRDADGVASFSEWGRLRYSLGAAFSAALFFDANGGEAYREFAVQQLGYALGDNARGYSFVVGFGAQSPRFPHHRNAYGVDWNPDDDYKNSVLPLHVLTGALVGGTSPPGSFPDRLTDYKTSEVSIDFNAALVGAASFVASLRPR